MYFKSPRKVLLKPWLCEGSGGESCLKIKGGWAGGVKTSCTYLSLAKIMMKATKTMMTNICDVWFYRWFKYCFSFVLNSWSINTVFKKKNRKTIFNPRINLKQNTFSDATCSKGNLCSLSRLAAIGASSLSAKSLHVWRNISCVSGSLARFDMDLLFAIHFPVPNRSKMLQTWFLGEVKVDAKLRDHIVAILTFGTRPRISESTLHVWTSKLC